MDAGFASMCVPMYIAEITPPKLRGKCVVIYQWCITAGLLIASLVGGAFSTNELNGWRYC